MANVSTVSITWYGHSTFLLETPGHTRLMFDPWLGGNPACPEALKKPPSVDLLLVSHGHYDHVQDAVAVARAGNPVVVAVFEVAMWLQGKGVQTVAPMNKGGSQEVLGLKVTMTDARHSSANIDENGVITYLGEPAGYVVRMEDGLTVYFAGDTSLFGDMALIGELYRPDIAFLPIGDRFTMGPVEAARAAAMLGVRQVVPMHWGTFPLLTGTPADLKPLLQAKGIQMLELKPGETAS